VGVEGDLQAGRRLLEVLLELLKAREAEALEIDVIQA